jgi:hypothetical protein
LLLRVNWLLDLAKIGLVNADRVSNKKRAITDAALFSRIDRAAPLGTTIRRKPEL